MKSAQRIYNSDPQTIESAIILVEKYKGVIRGGNDGFSIVRFPDGSEIYMHDETGKIRKPPKNKRGGVRIGAGRKPGEYQTIRIKRPKNQIADLGGETEAAKILEELLNSL